MKAGTGGKPDGHNWLNLKGKNIINDEAFYELISQRGRGGSFHGLEMIKIAADSNIEKMAFLLQLVQDHARLQ